MRAREGRDGRHSEGDVDIDNTLEKFAKRYHKWHRQFLWKNYFIIISIPRRIERKALKEEGQVTLKGIRRNAITPPPLPTHPPNPTHFPSSTHTHWTGVQFYALRQNLKAIIMSSTKEVTALHSHAWIAVQIKSTVQMSFWGTDSFVVCHINTVSDTWWVEWIKEQ